MKSLRMNNRLLSITILFVLAIMLSACGNAEKGLSDSSSEGDHLGKKEITIPFVSWATELASSHVIKEALEKVGYDVTLKEVNTGAMYIAVADGSADAMVSAWLPYTDVSYWEKFEGDLVDLGPSIKEAPLGLVVPSYVEIDSIEEMKENAHSIGEGTDWAITGIDPGAGQMQMTELAMKEYGLDNWTLKATSDAMMMAALDRAIKKKEDIIVTLWSPHWAMKEYDLKFLEDPREVFGKPDDIHTLTRKGLEEDSPAAYKILDQFEWDKEHLESVMVEIFKGTDPEQAAKEFIESNEELFKKWTKGVK
ncbi:glycine betaine ABC transporter substrate-binding protein [Filibacter tadaridae]|uniref:Glycine betaine/carnitine transport binding protein GbuC n=1 Tax=Filibacter tadaridae TaxID=2483811 RepID=A0A3P5WRK8_9BACL|nr:glycine betaine ABC transporter substrate-binding protein [Filibacter tadaridae]VDC24175.1 Glycine betaine/carnitine transport binding protein GbuC precursor [Filibacter tadaridae]